MSIACSELNCDGVAKARGWCFKHYQRWRSKEKPHHKRDWLYKLRPGEYDSMVERQGGLCAVCHHPPKSGLLDVDHDHKDGRIRGLLCRACNSYIGWYEGGTVPRWDVYLNDTLVPPY